MTKIIERSIDHTSSGKNITNSKKHTQTHTHTHMQREQVSRHRRWQWAKLKSGNLK